MRLGLTIELSKILGRTPCDQGTRHACGFRLPDSNQRRLFGKDLVYLTTTASNLCQDKRPLPEGNTSLLPGICQLPPETPGHPRRVIVDDRWDHAKPQVRGLINI